MKTEEISGKFQEMIAKMKQFFMKQKKSTLYIAVSIAILISVFAIVGYSYNGAYVAKIDGKTIGIVKEEEDFAKAVDVVKANLSKKYKTDVIFDGTISYERVKADRKELIAKLQLEKDLKNMDNFKMNAIGIIANKECVTAVSSKKDAENVIKAIKEIYKPDDQEEIEKFDFAEKIKMDKIQESMKNVKTKEEAIDYILKGTEEKREHEIQKGESFWTIARKYKISVEDLTKANLDVKPERLQIGQKISLLVPKPLLTIETITKKKLEEKIPYEIDFEETSALYKGEKKVKRKGTNGVKEIITQVIKQNGIQVAVNVLQEAVILSPQNQVVLKGTKQAPPKIGTGKLGNPTRGRLTSRYGWRWGRKHTGIDIGAPIGTTIKAADGGKVTFAGWRNGYGKCLIIDHGGNTKTYYAHTSKLLVKVGQKVFKGQKVALVGNTGRSTGPHLHFEVRKNNVPVNPLKYVKY